MGSAGRTLCQSILLTGVGLVAALPTSSASGAPVRLPTGKISEVRPKAVCVASSTCFSELRWASWGSKKAVARGRIVVSDNTTGNRYEGRAKLTVDRVKTSRFTRARWKNPKSFGFGGNSARMSTAVYYRGDPGFWNWVIQI